MRPEGASVSHTKRQMMVVQMAHILHAPRGGNVLPAPALISEILAVFGAAIRAAAAVEARRSPKAADLAILGIEKNALSIA